MNTPDILTPELINPLTYQSFKKLVDTLVAENQTTGPEQTEERIAYTKLNQQRMKRVEKQFKIDPELLAALQQPRSEWHWVVLVESWCGDGAQQIPAFAAIAEAVPTIELTIILRDENPAWMDTCLTNGSRAIPKLICLDAETNERLFTWGPRPLAILEQVLRFKEKNQNATKEEIGTLVHTLYAKDRSQSLQQDLLRLVQMAIPAKGEEQVLS
ncbi:thioredoxin family protein [Pontibacter sp. HSC-14F20]|uniref:thioredoxin family protein n=1 Tax=Pontibacter sp. HSC-14F20 TaxID=2864136 RepID=UPI001C730D6A|nr:thioredoxin family protein [Pontibacter sp. HSC-14F20]MBX0332313.1 thioredoxin family protein [Pontibacter sp. HSC-14F20]